MIKKQNLTSKKVPRCDQKERHQFNFIVHSIKHSYRRTRADPDSKIPSKTSYQSIHHSGMLDFRQWNGVCWYFQLKLDSYQSSISVCGKEKVLRVLLQLKTYIYKKKQSIQNNKLSKMSWNVSVWSQGHMNPTGWSPGTVRSAWQKTVRVCDNMYRINTKTKETH